MAMHPWIAPLRAEGSRIPRHIPDWRERGGTAVPPRSVEAAVVSAAIPLFRVPPLVDVPPVAEGTRVVAAHLVRDHPDRVRREAEVVGLLLVEDPVERLVVLLARFLRAVAVARRASLVDRAVELVVGEAAEVEAGALRHR